MTTDAVVLAEGVGRLLGVGEAIPMLMVLAGGSGQAAALAPEWMLGTSIADSDSRSDVLIAGWPVSLVQSQGSDGAATYVVSIGPLIEGGTEAQGTITSAAVYQPTITTITDALDALVPAWPKSLDSASQAEDVLTSALAVLVLGSLGLTGVASPEAIYRPTIAQSTEHAGVVSRFFGGSLAGSTGVLSEITALPRFDRVLLGATGSEVTQGGLLILRVTIADSHVSDDTDVVNMIFSPTLDSGIDFSFAHISPDGSTTVWVVNTRTGATTEYQNYAFNSFAQMGHKYLGATSAGLYELNGDDDVGTDVVARLRSGFGQFAGSRFSGFKAAYLGIRATGDLLFRLVYADDTVTNYAVKARDMETVKVNLGKGVRARYIAFELESTGQDFDLESVELVPMVAQRRV